MVAIPAKNESLLLGACLRSVNETVRSLRLGTGVGSVCVMVALDGCTDGTAAVAERAGAQTVMSEAGGVGAARDQAVNRGLAHLHLLAGPHVWVACTDADSLVPPNWLTEQLRHADAGADMVVGTVQPAMEGGERRSAWDRRHRLVEGHPHVHGANLGLRASTWAAVGGFGVGAAHEDVRLVERVRQARFASVATDTTRVTTSARPWGRAEGGFADYLRALDGQVG
ncbi:MAG TPA: glycosyltransferase family 2 protein [Ornithinimicrobium sp.]|uniref:glycosyltransferase n=1 Tax=Ornithinimicrobium sp. TaxID=1977084 RepID=UPI002B49ACE1|nr:glycosyltransferase family 2 protein [Ornithinimicrobium sp.]HKJ12246.1 glycosyltransferase family 2 protein [Ornithinimicrobium sp.]